MQGPMVFALTLMQWPWVGPEEYDYEVWKKFADKIRWRKGWGVVVVVNL